MIRFFRQIRQSLLMPDNVRKYLLYAFGEIFLVVIGILIALQINNWNENRKIEKFEIGMLKELESALEGDSTVIALFFEPRMVIKEAAIDTFSTGMIVNRVFSNDEFHHFYNDMDVDFEYRFNPGPYETIKSKGLDVITNDSLRSQITAMYERTLPSYKFFIDLAKDENVQLIQSLEREFIKREIVLHNEEHHIHLAPSVNMIYKNQAFLQVLDIQQYIARNSRLRINQIEELTADLKKVLRKELKRRGY